MKSPLMRRYRFSTSAVLPTLLALLLMLGAGNQSGPSPVLAAGSGANLDQCGNGSLAYFDGTPCQSANEWINGNLNESKSHYFEGDSIPYRIRMTNVDTSIVHTVTIEWDTLKGSKHAIDYLTGYNRTISGGSNDADPCAGVSSCGTPTTAAIPIDSFAVNQLTGQSFTLFGGAITSVSNYTTDSTNGDRATRITLTFMTTVANPVLAWGGHVATRLDWGTGNSAVSISGSPFHMRLIDLDGSGGNQDRSLASSAVIFPGSIKIIKDATPNGPASFPFTGSPSPLTDFNLVDDGKSENTKLFSNITNFQTYNVAETVPAGWTLIGILCTVSSPNGGSQTVTLPSVSINLKEGENVTCTITNEGIAPELTLVKTVVNNSGGTTNASAWSLAGTGSSSSFSGYGVSATDTYASLGPTAVAAGVEYTLSESGGPGGYSPTSIWSCTAGTFISPDKIILALGQSATCTITNDDVAPKLTLVKTVVNDDGGTKVVSDFPLFINGVAATSGTAYTQTANVLLTATETPQTGYTPWAWGGDCAADGTITLLLGDDKTCTITNDDVAPQLTLVKTVVNDDGGTRVASDFPLFINGVAATSGTAYTQTANVLLTATETPQTGYAPSAWGGECAADGTITLFPGDNKTCTITNDDIAPKLTLVKTVVNDEGGTKVVSDFPLFINGVAATSGTAYNQMANVLLTVTETPQTGYTPSVWGGDCAADGTITLLPGDDKTCSITNNDIRKFTIIVLVCAQPEEGDASPTDNYLFPSSVKLGSGTPTTSLGFVDISGDPVLQALLCSLGGARFEDNDPGTHSPEIAVTP